MATLRSGLVTLLFYMVHVGAGKQCYNPNSTPARPERMPCDARSDVVPCCNRSDLCLSNGPCLNADGNNAFTIQGCTDSSWPSPACTGYFSGPQDDLGFVYMWLCSVEGDDKTGWFCCGGYNASCCDSNPETSSASTLVEVPVATGAWKAFLAEETVSTGLPTATPTTASDVGSGERVLPQETRIGVAVGLGIGDPALISAALAWKCAKPIRQYFQRNNPENSIRTPENELSTEYHTELSAEERRELPA